MKVYAIFADATSPDATGKFEKLISSGYIVSGFDSSKEGIQTVAVSYGGCSTTFDILIGEAPEEEEQVDGAVPTGAILHLDAADLETGAVSSWSSKVGSFAAVQATEDKQPTVVNEEGYQAVRFDGNDTLAVSQFKGLNDVEALTIIAVSKAGTMPYDIQFYNGRSILMIDESSSYGGLFVGAYQDAVQARFGIAKSDLGNYVLHGTRAPVTSLSSTIFMKDGVNQTIYTDGDVFMSNAKGRDKVYGTGKAGDDYRLWIGKGAAESQAGFVGDIAEIMIYDRALNAEELAAVNAYIEEKYFTVEVPTATPEAGKTEEAVSVTLSCETEDAVIHYTTDGSRPSEFAAKYTAPIQVTETTTIKAVVVKNGRKSPVAEFTYDFTVDVTGVTLDVTAAELVLQDSEKQTVQLTAAVAPENATNKAVEWITGNVRVATVKDGLVTAVGKGETTITVKTKDGSFTAECTITVTEAAVDPDPDEPIIPDEPTEDELAAKAVDDMIAALGYVTIEDKDAIEAARAAYNALTDEQKALVQNLAVLEAAEAALEALQKPVRPSLPVHPPVSKPSKPVVTVKLPFADVPASAWYYDEVKMAWEAGLIDGMTATTYEPESTLTVAQAIKLAAALHQLEKLGKVTLTNGTGDWYSTYVTYAIANGIIEEAYADYTWAQMNAPATRAEFVHIFHGAKEAYAAMNTVADNAIPDVKVGDKYADEIYTFYRAGILTGNDAAGTFAPASSIKRSEVAAILIRMFDKDARQTVTLN